MAGEVDVLAVLRNVPWDSVAKTFGNCHSTLIGAIVQAWNGSADDRFALEPGCSSQRKAGNVGTRICDAILCKGKAAKPTPVGILEVEFTPFPSHILKTGERAPTIFERMKTYWFPGEERSQYFGSLTFSVLVLYVQQVGAKKEKYDDTAKQRLVLEGQSFLECVRNARQDSRDSRLFLVIAQKCHEDDLSGPDSIKDSIRGLNPYYPCTINRVEWIEITPTIGAWEERVLVAFR